MDPKELLEAQEAQDEFLEQEEPAEEGQDPIVSLAQKFGYRPDGKLPADKFLEKKLGASTSGSKVEREIRETRRELAELKTLLTAQKRASEEDELKVLHKKYDEAIDDNDKEEISRLAKQIARIEMASDKSSKKNSLSDDIGGDVKEIVEDFTENNPWVQADEEVSEFVSDRFKVLTAQGSSPKAALNQIKREARREFPDLFSDQDGIDLPKGRNGIPSVGGGRPQPSRGGIQSVSDLPRDVQADATEYVNWYSRENGVTKAVAFKEYMKIAKQMAGN